MNSDYLSELLESFDPPAFIENDSFPKESTFKSFEETFDTSKFMFHGAEDIKLEHEFNNRKEKQLVQDELELEHYLGAKDSNKSDEEDDETNENSSKTINPSMLMWKKPKPVVLICKKKKIDPVRAQARKTLLSALLPEQNSGDNALEPLVNKIEEELFDLLKENGQPKTKYKDKYRSILFNIRDKNSGLKEKLINSQIEPHALVRMSSAEMNEEAGKVAEEIKLLGIMEATRKKKEEVEKFLSSEVPVSEESTENRRASHYEFLFEDKKPLAEKDESQVEPKEIKPFVEKKEVKSVEFVEKRDEKLPQNKDRKEIEVEEDKKEEKLIEIEEDNLEIVYEKDDNADYKPIIWNGILALHGVCKANINLSCLSTESSHNLLSGYSELLIFGRIQRGKMIDYLKQVKSYEGREIQSFDINSSLDLGQEPLIDELENLFVHLVTNYRCGVVQTKTSERKIKDIYIVPYDPDLEEIVDKSRAKLLCILVINKKTDHKHHEKRKSHDEYTKSKRLSIENQTASSANSKEETQEKMPEIRPFDNMPSFDRSSDYIPVISHDIIPGLGLK